MVQQAHRLKGQLNEVGLFGGLMVFAPLIDGGTTHLPVLIIRLLLLAGFIWWILSSLRSNSLVIYRLPILALLVAFIAISGLETFSSSYTSVSIQGLVGLIMYAIFFFLLLHQLSDRSSVRFLTLIIVLMGLLEGLLGIAQYVWLGETRARGTFFNPNFFATYEAVTAVLAFSLLSWMNWAEHGWREKCLLGAAFCISLAALVLAQSRGAFIAFLLALVFLGLCRSWKLSLILPIAAVVAVIVLPNPIKERALAVSDQDPYAYTRLEIWKNSLDRIKDHPFGTGLGTYKYLSFKYRFPIETSIVRYEKRAESAHNEYLQMAVELGVGGVMLFLVGVAVWGWDVRKALLDVVSSADKGTFVGLSSGALVILAHAVMDSVFHEPTLVLLLILCGSLVLVLKRQTSNDRVIKWNIPFHYHPARLALVLFLAVASVLLIIQPAAAWFAYEQGNLASQIGDSGRAWEWYQRAIRIDPGAVAYRDAAARMKVIQFNQSGDPQSLVQAAEEMQICQALNPLDGRIPYRLGTLYELLAERAASLQQRANYVARAMESYQAGISVDPYSPFNYVELGKLRWRHGQLEEAQELFIEAITYEPNFLPARTFLAKIATQTGKGELARSQYEAIEVVQKRYKGRAVNALEHRYLDVNLE